MTVSNATPLIYMAKLGKLHLLKDLFTQIQIPSEVKIEAVDRGKAKGYPDAYVIEQAINEGWLVIGPLTEENTKKSEAFMQVTGIDIGEAQTIFLTKQKNQKLILIDHTNARNAAKQLGLNPRGTLYVILTATKRKLITKEEAKQTIEKLIEVNFYVSIKIYTDTLKTIEKL